MKRINWKLISNELGWDIKFTKKIVQTGIKKLGFGLYNACHNGSAEGVKDLIRKGADVNCRRYGSFPIIEAAALGFSEIVRILIDNGANVNLKGDCGRTALFYAWQGLRYYYYEDDCVEKANGYKETIRILKQHGAEE